MVTAQSTVRDTSALIAESPVRKLERKHDLAWVNIHEALQPSLAGSKRREIIDKAEQVWTLWIHFFRSIQKKILG